SLYLAAVGQSFFSLSLGMGIMVTYGGYLSKQTGSRLPSTATRVVDLDTLFAILVGIIIFTTVFTIGGESDQGQGMVFVVMPEVFNQMSVGGSVIAVIFLFLFFFGGLSFSLSFA